MTTIKFKYDKLVRDKIYQMMLDAGASVKVKDIKEEAELINYFQLKILEEAQEVVDAQSKQELAEELADCLEVIKAFSEKSGIGFGVIEKIAQEKKEKKGGFEQAVIIETVSLDDRQEFVEYREYLTSKPDKYPVVL